MSITPLTPAAPAEARSNMGHFSVEIPGAPGSALSGNQHSYSDRFVDLVADGFDCGVRVGYLSDSSLIARRVGPIYGSLVASPDYIRAHGSPDTPTDLASHEALTQETQIWQFMDGERTVTVQPQGRFKTDNGTALVSAAVAGLGIAWLPNCLTHEHVVSGALVAIMTGYPLPAAGAYVVRPPNQHPARKVRILTEMLIEDFARNPDVWGLDR